MTVWYIVSVLQSFLAVQTYAAFQLTSTRETVLPELLSVSRATFVHVNQTPCYYYVNDKEMSSTVSVLCLHGTRERWVLSSWSSASQNAHAIKLRYQKHTLLVNSHTFISKGNCANYLLENLLLLAIFFWSAPILRFRPSDTGSRLYRCFVYS